MEVLCAGEDLLRVECGQVSPSLLADLRCFSCLCGVFVLVVCLVACFSGVLVAVACFGFLSPSVSCRLTFVRYSHISCEPQAIAFLVERHTRILTSGFTLFLTSHSSVGLPVSFEIRRSLRVKKTLLMRM